MAEAQGLKDRNLQDYYEQLGATFSSKGWAYIVEDLQKIHDAANALDGVDSMEALHFRRGQVDIIKKLIAQPAVAAAAYTVLLEGEE